MRRLIPVLALALLAGCTHQSYVTNEKVDNTPMNIDPAMQQRQWEPVTAYYENGETHNWSTGFAYEPKRGQNPYYSYYLTDTVTYLVNVVTLPYTYYDQWHGVTSGGVKIPPSYTANPPQPPSTQPAE